MGCASCQEELASLRQRVVDLEAVLDELKDEYLALAKDFDELIEVLPDGKVQDDHEDE